jgi:phosphatidylglycerophosphate synthase
MTWSLTHALVMVILTYVSWVTGEPRVAAFGGAASLAVFVFTHRVRWTPDGRFGLANTVTTLRVALVALLGALPDAGVPSACLVLGVFLLDGLDGRLARRGGTTSSFGAAYDMEADALFVLVAGLRLGIAGRLGAWILVQGLIRYAYVVAISLLPTARGDEPRSRAARYVFAGVVLSLAASFWPIPAHCYLAAVMTLLLVVSFARSAFWSFGPDVREVA